MAGSKKRKRLPASAPFGSDFHGHLIAHVSRAVVYIIRDTMRAVRLSIWGSNCPTCRLANLCTHRGTII